MATVRNSTGYKGGRIVRIRLKDFLTYSRLKLYPTVGLNLLIGPNGSGKSSIVCAIYLGLAGKPNFTGRQIRLADYVKNGCQTAEIELTLDDPQRKKNLVITRIIKKTGCTSQFLLDKKLATEHEVEKEVSRFNIQVNNLCQFLPQEKVADFSRMTAKQLLESMLQAVGDHEMFKKYKELIQLRSSARNCESRIKGKKDHIEKQKQKNQMIESDVQLFEERESNIKKIAEFESVKPLFQYFEKYDRVKEQRIIKESLQAELTDLESKLEPLETERNHLDEYLTNSQQKLGSLVGAVRKANSHSERIVADIKNLDQKISDTRLELNIKLEDAEDKKRRIMEFENQLAGFQHEFAEAQKTKEQMIPQLEKMKQEKAKIKEQLSEVNSKLYQVRSQIAENERLCRGYKLEFDKLNDIDRKKMENLMKIDRHAYEAVLWLKDNRNLFKGKVYDPIFTLIQTTNRDCVKYIENHIKHRDLIVFLCEDKEDTKKFTKILREEKNLAINAALVPQRSLLTFQPPISVDHLRSHYHFTNYLKDLFQAPEAVIAFLCENYNIHATPVGDANTEAYLLRSGQTPPFPRYYTTNTSYFVKRSRYGSRNTSTSVADIREKGILSPSANTQERQQEIKKTLESLEQKNKVLKQEETVLIQQDATLSEELERRRKYEKEFSNHEESMKALRSKIAHKQNVLAATKAQKIDVNEEKRKAAEIISDLRTKKLCAIGDLHKYLQECLSSIKQKAVIRFVLSFCQKKKRELDIKCDEANNQVSKKRHDLQEALNKYYTMKKEAKQLSQSLDEHTRLREKLEEKYENIPLNLEQLETEINRLKAKVNCMTVADKAVIDEHAKRRTDIKESEKDLLKSQRELETVNEAITEKRDQWIVPLENLVGKISQTFSSYFNILGCVGEISVNKSENPDDFDQYGLSIRVKYRDSAPLRELSQAHHSGGECNVAAIIFILSLQEQTEVPFRCVDEINQGMDSINERCIFELVAASAEKCSQYFLLTPKLLPGLAYSSGMKIHIIHNGPSLDINYWNIRMILQRRLEAD